VADYINKNILSQAYIHVEPQTLDLENEFEEFKIYIEDFVKTRTSFYLGNDATTKIEFEEGSLIARITVIGTLLGTGICNYSDFREGLKYIYQDSKRLAEYIVSEVQFNTGAKNQDVIRLEARTGIIGSLNKIYLQLENIKSSAERGTSSDELIEKINKAQSDLEELLINLKNDEDIKLIKNGLIEAAKNIPQKPNPPKDRINSHESIIFYQRRRNQLINLLKVN